MRSRKLFLISAVFFLIALVAICAKWNGSAGLGAGDSLQAWAINLEGSVHGWAAIVGMLGILIGLGTAIVGLIRMFTD